MYKVDRKQAPHKQGTSTSSSGGSVSAARSVHSGQHLQQGAALMTMGGMMQLQQLVGNQAVRQLTNPSSGGASQPVQLARLEQADPLLANGRDLLDDTATLLMGNERAGVDQENLLDTTYDNMGENLILDIDMLYEENLQRDIEHNGKFTADMKEIVELIHRWISFRSVDEASVRDESKDLKEERKGFALDHIGGKLGGEVSMDDLQENKWNMDTSGIEDPEEKRMTVGYVKLMKMLETQFPYFGGSEEYHHNERDKLEYWIYHMSTLTKDPERQFEADDPKSKLMKPMIDYRTRKDGLVPHQNQRNLGTGIIELTWEEFPPKLKGLTHKNLLDLYEDPSSILPVPVPKDKKKRREKLETLFETYRISPDQRSKMLQVLWNRATEDDRKAIYGDVLRLPWSDAHIKKTHDKTPENVAGVMGNILETPQKAKERYVEDLKKFEDTPEALGRFNHVDEEEELSKGAILDEFETKHQRWYDTAKENHKPIIGGISGHTLGYLNLYEEALAKAEVEAATNREVEAERSKYPSMEVLRANMLGALIGDKRHHSYDEVMTASHAMPTHDSQGTLVYQYPGSYEDVLLSGNTDIKKAAEDAQTQTVGSVDSPESNTVLSKLIDHAGGDALADVQEGLRTYIRNNLRHDEGVVDIVGRVNELARPPVREQEKVEATKTAYMDEASKTFTSEREVIDTGEALDGRVARYQEESTKDFTSDRPPIETGMSLRERMARYQQSVDEGTNQ